MNSTNYIIGDRVEQTNIRMLGSMSANFNSLSAVTNLYKSWFFSSQLMENSTLIGVSNDGLIPFWKLLPDNLNTSANVSKLKQLYNNYLKEYNDSILKQFTYNSNGDIEIEGKYVRLGEETIDDSGRFEHNVHDIVDLNDYGYNCDLLVGVGYKKMDITISMDIKEINHGYQYVMLYSNEKKDNTYKMDESGPYECNGSNLASTFTPAIFVFNDVPIDCFRDSKKIVIRYGASGDGEDDWVNRRIYISIKYKK